MLLHLRLGHFSYRYLLWLIQNKIDIGMTLTEDDLKAYREAVCEGCKALRNQLHVKPSQQNFDHYNVFEYICMDGSGPLPVTSIHGNVYIWAIMCLRSRWVILKFSKQRRAIDIQNILNEVLNYIKYHRGTVNNLAITRKLLTDLGSEFFNKTVEKICIKEGIEHKKSRYGNASSKRTHRTEFPYDMGIDEQNDVDRRRASNPMGGDVFSRCFHPQSNVSSSAQKYSIFCSLRDKFIRFKIRKNILYTMLARDRCLLQEV